MQFSLRTLIAIILICAAFCGGYVLNISRPTEINHYTPVLDDPCMDSLFSIYRDFTEKELLNDFFEIIETTVVTKQRFGQAVSALIEVDVENLIRTNPNVRYIGVFNGDALSSTDDSPELCGVTASYDSQQDWCFPRSGHNGESQQWPHFTRIFCEKFNRIKEQKHVP